MQSIILSKRISIAFDHFLLMVLLANPTDVVLSTCIVMGGWGRPISSSVVQMGKAYLALRKLATILASVMKYMKVFMSWKRVSMALLVVGRLGGLLPF